MYSKKGQAITLFYIYIYSCSFAQHLKEKQVCDLIAWYKDFEEESLKKRCVAGLVIPDNRAIKKLKGEAQAKSKSFRGLRRRKLIADPSLFYFHFSLFYFNFHFRKSQAKSKSFPGPRRRKLIADPSLFFSCNGLERDSK